MNSCSLTLAQRLGSPPGPSSCSDRWNPNTHSEGSLRGKPGHCPCGSTTKLSKSTTVSVLAQAPTWPETDVGRSASRNLKPSSEPDTCVPPFETVTDTSCQRAIAAGTFSASLSTDGWPCTH